MERLHLKTGSSLKQARKSRCRHSSTPYYLISIGVRKTNHNVMGARTGIIRDTSRERAMLWTICWNFHAIKDNHAPQPKSMVCAIQHMPQIIKASSFQSVKKSKLSTASCLVSGSDAASMNIIVWSIASLSFETHQWSSSTFWMSPVKQPSIFFFKILFVSFSWRAILCCLCDSFFWKPNSGDDSRHRHSECSISE